MKNQNFFLLFSLFIFGLISLNSCKKNESHFSNKKEASKSNAFDPIVSISVDKKGTATIKLKSGIEFIKDSVLKNNINKENDGKVTQQITLPITTLNNTLSKFDDGDSESGGGASFTFTLTRYPSGYVSVSVWPATLMIDDYVVRATPIITSSGTPVLWEINYVYTRAGASFYSTQVEMSTYF